MKLSKNHWLVKLAWGDELFLSDKNKPAKIPTQTTLCHLISCIMVKMPVFVFFITILTVVAGPFFFLDWLIKKIGTWIDSRKQVIEVKNWWTKSLIKLAITDFKNKTCTKIDIE